MQVNIFTNKNSDVVLVPFTKDQWSQVNTSFADGLARTFEAESKEMYPLMVNGRMHFLLGLGATEKTNELLEHAQFFAQKLKGKIKCKDVEIAQSTWSIDAIQHFLLGLYLGTYNYKKSDLHPFEEDAFEIIIDRKYEQQKSAISTFVMALHSGQTTAMDWLNKPANLKTPPMLVDFIQSLGQSYNWDIEVWDRNTCAAKGLNAYLAVNQASVYDAAFTVIHYRHPNAKKNIGLVGKCVIFDTGGVSIKPSNNMHYMKSDMGGATAVLGTLIAASIMQLEVNLTVVLPITDNVVGAKAYLPGDVVRAYNGKTIEVLNTDAEGRLTLADALAYASQNFELDCLIDLATLTGSAVRMFGETCAPVFSSNETLKNGLIKSGETTAQRLWPMPLWDIWEEELKSDVADYQNISSAPYGDCIVAAKFLQQFVKDGVLWAHMDIAGVAFGKSIYTDHKSATGWGVRLLIDFLKSFE